jgi:glucosyl-dolichyl phosphate glucuronosyltransferase
VRAESFQNNEIIVIVDHHPAFQAALTALPDATVVDNRDERGLSGARNTGVSIAGRDGVAFLDDDAAADPDWLKFRADSYADPAVIGVAATSCPAGRSHDRPGSPPNSTGSSAVPIAMPESRRQVREPARRKRVVPPGGLLSLMH